VKRGQPLRRTPMRRGRARRPPPVPVRRDWSEALAKVQAERVCRPLQERHAADPWRLLVCCTLMNLAPGARAEPVAAAIFEAWPTPERLARAPETRLQALLRPLGMWRRRADTLRRLSAEYRHSGTDACTPAEVVRALHGVGAYAADSWAIFVEGRLDVEPADRELRRRLAALRALRDGAGRPAAESGPDRPAGLPPGVVVEPPYHRRTFWEALADSPDEGEAVLAEMRRT
jgi:endonuclease III